jgi:hypothetical protein
MSERPEMPDLSKIATGHGMVRCGNCEFYEPDPKMMGAVGFCYGDPPKVVVVEMVFTAGIDGRQYFKAANFDSFGPRVRAERRPCSKHKMVETGAVALPAPAGIPGAEDAGTPGFGLAAGSEPAPANDQVQASPPAPPPAVPVKSAVETPAERRKRLKGAPSPKGKGKGNG